MRRLLIYLGAAGFLLALYMVLLASAPPTIRSLRVPLAGWPAGTAPLRVVLLSDLHVSTPGDTPARLRDTVGRVNALKPDLVLLAGDFLANGIGGARAYDAATSVAPLAAPRARLGVYAVLGNHDYGDPDGLRAALAATHVRLLDNSAARVGPIAIVGVSDAFSNHADLPVALAAWRRVRGIPIVLTHSPDITPSLPLFVHLALAGHTHCG